jgi:hypothetical protein
MSIIIDNEYKTMARVGQVCVDIRIQTISMIYDQNWASTIYDQIRPVRSLIKNSIHALIVGPRLDEVV